MTVDLEKVYFEFDADLRRFLRHRVADPAAVDDILQETYLRIYQHADSLRDPDRLQSWVFQIVRNNLVDYYRRKRHTVELSETLAAPNEPDETDQPAHALAHSIRQIILCLPDGYRQALILTGFENVKQHELAKHLGLSISGAKSRVQRARKKLKSILRDCCHVELDRHGRVLSFAADCDTSLCNNN